MIWIIIILGILGIIIEGYAYYEAQKCEVMIKSLQDISPEAVIGALYVHLYGIESESTYHSINVLSDHLGIVIYHDGYLKEPNELKRLVLQSLTREELIYLTKIFLK